MIINLKKPERVKERNKGKKPPTHNLWKPQLWRHGPASLAEREAGPFVEQILLLAVTFQSPVCGRADFYSVFYSACVLMSRGGRAEAVSNRLSDRLSAAGPYLRLPALSPILPQPSQAVDSAMDVLGFKLCMEEKDLTAFSFSGRKGQAMFCVSCDPHAQLVFTKHLLSCQKAVLGAGSWVPGAGMDTNL